MLKYLNQIKSNQEEGFTLVELLVVILIIGILAAIAIPLFLNNRKSASEATLKNDLKNAGTITEGTFSMKVGYTPVVDQHSEGNHLKQVTLINKENYCLSGYSESDPDNVWYYSSIDSGLSQKPVACLIGAENSGDNDENLTNEQKIEQVINSPESIRYFKVHKSLENIQLNPEYIIAASKAEAGIALTPAELTLKATFDSLLTEYETLWEFFGNDPANKDTADYVTQMSEGNFMKQEEFIVLRDEYIIPYEKISELTKDFNESTHDFNNMNEIINAYNEFTIAQNKYYDEITLHRIY